MDVKKIGRITDGGGWRALGRESGSIERDRSTKVEFDYVHSLVDDHCRLAYSEVLSDEKGTTCAAFLERAIAYFAAHGITQIERLMTDNAWASNTVEAASRTSPAAPPSTGPRHRASADSRWRMASSTRPVAARRADSSDLVVGFGSSSGDHAARGSSTGTSWRSRSLILVRRSCRSRRVNFHWKGLAVAL
jgi:hypothetical protein